MPGDSSGFGPSSSGKGNLASVNVLVATDAKWIADAVVAALGDDETRFTVCSEGRAVSRLIEERAEADGSSPFDVAVLDLQIGTMGAMAITMALRLDESSGLLPRVPVLMLLDREADIHLARRSGAEGWIVKPLDPLRLRRAALAVARGEIYHNGVRSAVEEAAEVTDDSEDTEAGGDEAVEAATAAS